MFRHLSAFCCCLAIVVVLSVTTALPVAAGVTDRLVLQHYVRYNSSGTTGCTVNAGDMNNTKVLNFDAVSVNESDKDAMDKLYICSLEDPRSPGKPFLCFLFNGTSLWIKCSKSNSACSDGFFASRITVRNRALPFFEVFSTVDQVAKSYCLHVGIAGTVLDIGTLDGGYVAMITIAVLLGIGFIVFLHILKRKMDLKKQQEGEYKEPIPNV